MVGFDYQGKGTTRFDLAAQVTSELQLAAPEAAGGAPRAARGARGWAKLLADVAGGPKGRGRSWEVEVGLRWRSG